ncbi:alpha/beta hydrolase [Acaryochloris sp. IP29b_bin.148]|uniref:alpha/beta hydrolase n=1 Tax=Acaryochloris sp. IP29b_bin.148 TaxID=2969218 RepID=UPI002630D546|nr:alpha/beta hydrolase [Acaryochloris sp. IP29b_bin.148]
MKTAFQSLLSWSVAGLTTMNALFFATQTQAAESIFVRYKDTEVTVTRSELNDFSNTGELPPSLEKLLDTDMELPEVARKALSTQITVPTFLQNFLEGSNGEFLLFKLDQAISSTSGRTEDGLESLKTAVLNSIEDERVSFIEIIDKYPQNTIRVNLTNLESTYTQVSGFVEKTLPALEVAKGVLSDFICDCNTTQADSETNSGSTYQAEKVSHNCADQKPATTVSENSNSPKGQSSPQSPSSTPQDPISTTETSVIPVQAQ